MKRTYKTALALTVLGVVAAHADAILISDDFASGTIKGDLRIRTNQADGSWYNNLKDGVSTDWEISDGVIKNANTTPDVVASEGALSQVVATSGLSSTLTKLTLSFDYVVGASSTLKLALIGYTANLQDGQSASTLLMNNGTANGALQNNTQAELRNGDMNLLTGGDYPQSMDNSLTFAANASGSYSASFDVTAYAWHADEAVDANPANTPGLSGSIASIADFDYIALVIVNDLSGTGGTTTSLDNVSLVAAIPEPAVLGLVAIFGGGLLVSRRLFDF
ncbi:hypothetical protein [Pontiella sp.]|uniref:hypothetical protein n=1 Tax=Pontiella sp. TaxID=2837462 RepID=UPI003568E314